VEEERREDRVRVQVRVRVSPSSRGGVSAERGRECNIGGEVRLLLFFSTLSFPASPPLITEMRPRREGLQMCEAERYHFHIALPLPPPFLRVTSEASFLPFSFLLHMVLPCRNSSKSLLFMKMMCSVRCVSYSVAV